MALNFTSTWNVLGRLRKRTALPRTRVSRKTASHRFLEHLEDRCLLATFNASGTLDAFTSLNFHLKASETLTVTSINGTGYQFKLSGSATWSGPTSTPHHVQYAGSTLVVNTYSYFHLFQIVDDAAGSNIVFGSTSNHSYDDSISIKLNSSPGVVTFKGSTSFSGGNYLSLETSNAVSFAAGATLATASGGISFLTDQVSLAGSNNITTSGTFSQAPWSASVPIDLGAFNGVVSAGTAVFGSGTTGSVFVNSTAGFASNLSLNTPTGFSPASNGMDLDLGGRVLSFAAGTPVSIGINGTSVDSQYTQLDVNGVVDLTGASLAPAGAFIGSPGTTYTIVNGISGVRGTFNNLPEGATFNLAGRNLQVNYGPTTVILTELAPPSITANPGNQSVNAFSTATFAASAVGYPLPVVQWQKSTDGGASWSDIANAISTSYTTPTLVAADTGSQYRANFGNSQGSATTLAALLTVNKIASSVTLTSSSAANTSTYGNPITFTATVTAGATGAVTFMDGSTTLGTGTISNGTATFTTSALGGGSHGITVVYSGDANYAVSTSSVLTQTVNKAGTTTTGLTSSLNSSTFGTSVTFTVTVTAGATGGVTFKDGSTTLGTGAISNGTAIFSTSALGAGSHGISADYGGDSNFNGSTSSVLTQTVTKATSATNGLSSNLNPSTYGTSVTFTATVTAGATGTVTFKEGTTTLGTGTLGNGTATLSLSTLAVGNHSITAVYAGDTNFTGSTSGAFTQTVKQSGSTTSALSSSLNPSTYGTSVTFTATVTAGATGTVTFKDGSTTLGTGTISNGTATFSTSALDAGSHSITAVYGGDANFTGSTSGSFTQTVKQSGSTTSGLSSSLNPSTYGTSVTFTATVTPGATGMVTFNDGSTTLGTSTISKGSVTFSTSSLGVGSHDITAVYGGDTNYTGSTSSGLKQTVSKAISTVSGLSSSLNPSTFGSSVRFTATVAGDATGAMTFSDGSMTLGTAILSNGTASFTTSNLGAGSRKITAAYSGDANYLGSTSTPLIQTVNRSDSSITDLSSSQDTSGYGTPITFTTSLNHAATGTVTFKDGSTSLGQGTITNGTATFTTFSLAAGTHRIKAEYAGDVNFIGSSSIELLQTVTKASSTVSSLVSSANPATPRYPVTFKAMLAGLATGTVSFLDGNTLLGTAPLVDGSAVLTTSSLLAGSHSILAVYGGDNNFTGTSSDALSLRVEPLVVVDRVDVLLNKNQVTACLVHFDRIDLVVPSTLRNIANYKLVQMVTVKKKTTEKVVPLSGVTFDTSTGLVKITPARGFALNGVYQLKIDGFKILDVWGRGVDADRQEQPGGLGKYVLTKSGGKQVW